MIVQCVCMLRDYEHKLEQANYTFRKQHKSSATLSQTIESENVTVNSADRSVTLAITRKMSSLIESQKIPLSVRRPLNSALMQ